MVNSKAALEAIGTILWGPMVPCWFDGDCSVPKGLRWMLKPKKGKEPCKLHDWCYMLIAILYEPETIPWNMALHQADAQLRWNLVLMRKRKRIGRAWGWVYYRGVRMPFVGGRNNVSRDPANHKRRPTNPEQLKECIVLARQFNYGELTEQARDVFRHWGRQMDLDIRKELKDG